MEIKIKKQTRILSGKLGFNYTKVLEAITKGGYLISEDKPVSGIKEFIGILSGLKISPNDIEAILYSLIMKSLIKTSEVLFLSIEDHDFKNERKASIINSERTQFLTSAEEEIEDFEFILDNRFFQYPDNLSFVQNIKSHYLKWLKFIEIKETKITELSDIFEKQFIVELNKVWHENPKLYKNITDKLESPFTERLEKLDEWNRYHKSIIDELKKPIFEEEFSLEQIFIPLRAGVPKYEKEPWTYKLELVWIEEYLNNWVLNEDTNSTIKFISGGPGSGKSSLVKKWAKSLIQEGNINVLIINLQWFNIKGELLKSIDDYLSSLNHNMTLGFNPLKENDKNKLVIVFDGLDELTNQGEFAERIAAQFLGLLEREDSIRNQQGSIKRCFFLVTGRELTIQLNEEKIGTKYEICQVMPYLINEDNFNTPIENSDLLYIDQRNSWWKKYGKLKGKRYRGVPSNIKSKLEELTSQPFLNYLVAWNINDGGLDINKIESNNTIYRNIIEQVLKRNYSKLDHPTTSGIKPQLFFKVLQEIAIAAWKGGDARIAQLKDIELRLKTANLKEYFEIFNKEANQNTIKLLTTFYFRQHSFIGGERKIEFTHKTFGEYLVSTALIDKILQALKSYTTEITSLHESVDILFRQWFEITSNNQIDNSILTFINEELKTRYRNLDISKLQELLTYAIHQVLNNGISINVEGDNLNNHLNKVCNAEEAILLTSVVFHKENQLRFKLESNYKGLFGDWLHRTNRQAGNHYRLINKNLSSLEFERQDLFIHNFYKSELSENVMGNTNFSRALFRKGFFRNNVFEGCQFIHADFEEAVFENVTFIDCTLRGANFRFVKFYNVKFEKCNLNRCDFTSTKINDVSFQDSILSYSKFKRSNIDWKVLMKAQSLRGIKFLREDHLRKLKSGHPSLNNEGSV